MTGLIPYNMFDNFFGDRWVQNRNVGNEVFKIDVKENDEDYSVEAELPGVKKNEINLNVDDKMLYISVNREEKAEEEKGNYIHRERRSSSMSRGIRLAGANLGDVKAKLDDGVLAITVPKQNKANESRRIDIQ